MDKASLQAVRARARDACEYCWLPQSILRLRFQIDHIIARKHRGDDELDNLALACGRCNRHKGPNVSGVDPASGQVTRLFHPRTDNWADHFEWRGVEIAGRTAIGRVTVDVLVMNHPSDIAIRMELRESGRFPTSPG